MCYIQTYFGSHPYGRLHFQTIMGAIWSAFNILESVGPLEETTETRPDGTIITRRKNPWVAALKIVSATTIVIAALDGGTGMVSQFGTRYKQNGVSSIISKRKISSI